MPKFELCVGEPEDIQDPIKVHFYLVKERDGRVSIYIKNTSPNRYNPHPILTINNNGTFSRPLCPSGVPDASSFLCTENDRIKEVF